MRYCHCAPEYEGCLYDISLFSRGRWVVAPHDKELNPPDLSLRLDESFSWQEVGTALPPDYAPRFALFKTILGFVRGDTSGQTNCVGVTASVLRQHGRTIIARTPDRLLSGLLDRRPSD